MVEVFGNLWDSKTDAICITTNGIQIGGKAVMGGGCAREARDRFPGVDRELGELLQEHGNHVFRLNTPRHGWYDGETGETWVIEVLSFPTKEDFRDPSSLALIEQSAKELVHLTELYEFRHVTIPRPGCGLGGLDWEREVRPLLAPILDERFAIISPR